MLLPKIPMLPKNNKTKMIISTAASVAGVVMVLRSTVDYLPRDVQQYIYTKLKTSLTKILFSSSELTLVIEKFDNLNRNKLYNAAKLYLEPIIPPTSERLKVSMSESQVSVSLENNQEIIDTFNGVSLKWIYKVNVEGKDRSKLHNYTVLSENNFFELSFHKKHKNMVLDTYLKHVIDKSEEIRRKNKIEKEKVKLFALNHERMVGRGGIFWQTINLEHPATFDTLAMDKKVKKMIMEDLERFVKRKEFYKRVGKAWKRGYLLFGPPGTGKSSLIAAMANYLKFDIYDLQLTDLTNSQLKSLLLSTANRSILVVEDIDCSFQLQNRFRVGGTLKALKDDVQGNKDKFQSQVTLSGMLNCIDGLWSSCGDERIIIFTTNDKEKLDPALLRPGRMDMHILMSYCTPCGFKMLASNYLEISEHPLFTEIEELIEVTEVTPAEIGEQLMRSEEPEIALRGLIEFLEKKNRAKVEKQRGKSDKTTTSTTSNEESGAAEVNSLQKEEVKAIDIGRRTQILGSTT